MIMKVKIDVELLPTSGFFFALLIPMIVSFLISNLLRVHTRIRDFFYAPDEVSHKAVTALPLFDNLKRIHEKVVHSELLQVTM